MSDWRERAACREVDTEVFFPTHYLRRSSLETPRAVCAGCPVQEQCLDLALQLPPHMDRAGIFAGLTPRERDELRAADVTVSYDRNPTSWAWLRGGPDWRTAHAEDETQRQSA